LYRIAFWTTTGHAGRQAARPVRRDQQHKQAAARPPGKVQDVSMIEELKALLISELNLEEVTPEDIDENAPLFGDGLGLDSIDALELAVILDKRYGVKIKAKDSRNAEIFASLSSLAQFVSEHRTP